MAGDDNVRPLNVRPLWKRIAKAILKLLHLEVHLVPGGKPSPLRPWEDNRDFLALMEEIASHTLVAPLPCFNLYQLVRRARFLEGEIAEAGVYRGGTAQLLAHVAQNKQVHLFDTFSGMPAADPSKDLHKAGDFSDTSLDSVKARLSKYENVIFHPGFFPETAASVTDLKFSFVHVDVDIYRSVMDCCLFFYPRMTIGGVMVFDDYGQVSCPGAKDAIDKFLEGKSDAGLYLPSGQYVLIKTSAVCHLPESGG